jgi:hypothetical protein
MNRTTAKMRMIAERLIDHETPKKASAVAADGANFQVVERLRPQFATLMGHGGFRALLARALKLAGTEVSWLRKVQVGADGTLEGWTASRIDLGPAEFHDGCVVLLAQLLGLLVAFIGPGLTSRLMCEAWPQLAADNLDFGNGDRK